jgi:hypothetical protein
MKFFYRLPLRVTALILGALVVVPIVLAASWLFPSMNREPIALIVAFALAAPSRFRCWALRGPNGNQSSSAIWTAFNAAPFKSWSAATNMLMDLPDGSDRSLRIRPASTSPWPEASLGMGK